MKVDCLYRFMPLGEIIQSKYDTDTGIIDNVPPSIFNIVLDPSKWCQSNYNIAEAPYPVGIMEKYMYEHPECYLCIEVDVLGFYAFRDNRVILIIRDWDNNTPNFLIQGLPFHGTWRAIGVRPTKVRQFSKKPYLARLQYNEETHMIYTGDGNYPLNFSPSVLEDVPQTIKGYVGMVKENKFAIGFIKEEVRYLNVSNGLLRLV